MDSRRLPWVLDNGAFADWKAERAFDQVQFRDALAKASLMEHKPEFVVVPDRVAGGLDSLAMSLEWVEECARVAPPYLVLQDGMTERDVEPSLDRFAGLFVGGTLPWKLRTGRNWVEFSHRHNKLCHIGRVGTVRRVMWARRIGVDSIDSSLPLWSSAKLSGFVQAVQRTTLQLEFDIGE